MSDLPAAAACKHQMVDAAVADVWSVIDVVACRHVMHLIHRSDAAFRGGMLLQLSYGQQLLQLLVRGFQWCLCS